MSFHQVLRGQAVYLSKRFGIRGGWRIGQIQDCYYLLCVCMCVCMCDTFSVARTDMVNKRRTCHAVRSVFMHDANCLQGL